MVEILCFVIIALLIIAILILIFKKPKNIEAKAFHEVQKEKMEDLNLGMKGLTQSITDQLRDVYVRIGKVENISDDISSLNKTLSNNSTIGGFGELQLERLLELTIPGHYEKNYHPHPNSNPKDKVEFAIKIPNGKNKEYTRLPVDAKFNLVRYVKVVNAYEEGDKDALDKARKEFVSAIKQEATKIKKYIKVPYTTQFAIMYLPNEGIYLEAVKTPGLQLELQERGIIIAGPSTIHAILNALNMSFNMVEINEHADIIRKNLAKIKHQFEKFNKDFDNIEKGIEAASKGLVGAISQRDEINSTLNDVSLKED